MRLGIVAGLWAALVGPSSRARYRRQVAEREDEAADRQERYEFELEREVAARREHELEVEADARRLAEEESREDILALRAELQGLRQTLQTLLGGEFLVERYALRAESTRMRSLPEGHPLNEPAEGAAPARAASNVIPMTPKEEDTDLINRVRGRFLEHAAARGTTGRRSTANARFQRGNPEKSTERRTVVPAGRRRSDAGVGLATVVGVDPGGTRCGRAEDPELAPVRAGQRHQRHQRSRRPRHERPARVERPLVERPNWTVRLPGPALRRPGGRIGPHAGRRPRHRVGHPDAGGGPAHGVGHPDVAGEPGRGLVEPDVTRAAGLLWRAASRRRREPGSGDPGRPATRFREPGRGLRWWGATGQPFEPGRRRPRRECRRQAVLRTRRRLRRDGRGRPVWLLLALRARRAGWARASLVTTVRPRRRVAGRPRADPVLRTRRRRRWDGREPVWLQQSGCVGGWRAGRRPIRFFEPRRRRVGWARASPATTARQARRRAVPVRTALRTRRRRRRSGMGAEPVWLLRCGEPGGGGMVPVRAAVRRIRRRRRAGWVRRASPVLMVRRRESGGGKRNGCGEPVRLLRCGEPSGTARVPGEPVRFIRRGEPVRSIWCADRANSEPAR